MLKSMERCTSFSKHTGGAPMQPMPNLKKFQACDTSIRANNSIFPNDLIFFREATKRICSSLDLQEALEQTFAFLKRFAPSNYMSFSFFEPDSGTLKIAARVADFEIAATQDSIALSAEAQKFLKFNVDNFITMDFESCPQFAEEIAGALGHGKLTGLRLILRIKGERIGGVSVLSSTGEHFTKEHARLLGLLHDPFAIAMSNYLRYLRVKELMADDNKYLQRELHRLSGDEIIGDKFGLSEVMEQVRQVAPRNSPVLLLGETGVGKEVIANAIHYASARRNGPLIKINCGAIPETLIDSELFGHEKGAFTGATSMKRGRFERASGGTIFLDEVGELPPAAQVRLLRVLQEKTIERVGGSEPLTVNVRVIAATHRDLESMVAKGEFRDDLWYRINVFPIRIPPLRERQADIPALVQHFIDRKSRELNLRYKPAIAEGTLERLQQYEWPGNVRELENLVERELIRAKSQNAPLRFEGIVKSQSKEKPSSAPIQIAPPDEHQDLNSVLRSHLLQVLQSTNGKIQGPDGAAALLKVHPSTLRHRLRKLGIPFGRIVDFKIHDE